MNKGVVRRAIVTPDKHFPLADKKAINVVCKAIEFIKPDTEYVGSYRIYS